MNCPKNKIQGGAIFIVFNRFLGIIKAFVAIIEKCYKKTL